LANDAKMAGAVFPGAGKKAGNVRKQMVRPEVIGLE
jgi:hypothetical protein